MESPGIMVISSPFWLMLSLMNILADHESFVICQLEPTLYHLEQFIEVG